MAEDSFSGIFSIAASLAGVTIQGLRTRTGSGQIAQVASLPAGIAGTLTTRTGDAEGTFTLAAGHGLEVNDIIDVYWAGGLRYGMKVSAVNGNDVTAGGTGGPGAGDVLPAEDTAIVADEQVTLDVDFDGDKLEMIVVASSARAHIDFQDASGNSLEAQELSAGEPWDWASGMGAVNPLSGNPVDRVKLSNGDSSAAAIVKIGLVYNSDE